MPRNSFNVTPGIIEMKIHQPIDVNPFLPDNFQKLMQKTWEVINSAL